MNDKRIVYLLFVSLAINLVFIGGLGWSYAFAERNHRPISSNLGWAIRGLSAERSNQLMSSLNLPVNNQNLSIAAARSNMIKAQQDANEESPNFQEDTLRGALSAFEQVTCTIKNYHEQMTLLFSKMTDQERKAASDFLNRIGPRRSQKAARPLSKSRRSSPTTRPFSSKLIQYGSSSEKKYKWH